MKILQVGPYPPPIGGWSLHIKYFAEYMTQKGVQNGVLNIGMNRKIKSSEYIDVQNGLDYLLKHLKYLSKGYHIYVHVDGGPTKALILTIISVLTSMLFFRRIFLSFHAGINQQCFDKKHRVKRTAFKAIFKLSKSIICNSKNVKDKIVEMGIPGQKIYPIPCFTARHLQFDEQLDDKQGQFISKHQPVLFCYSLYSPDYRLDILLECLMKAKVNRSEIGLILVGGARGDQEDSFSKEVSELIDKFDLKHNILQVGDISHDNFLSLMQQADLVIRTHLRDGVCSSVLEAVSMQVPVVASYNETRPEGIITYEGNDGNDLFEKVEYALDHLDDLKYSLSSLINNRDTLYEEFDVIVKG